jgi:hypothetical protein
MRRRALAQRSEPGRLPLADAMSKLRGPAGRRPVLEAFGLGVLGASSSIRQRISPAGSMFPPASSASWRAPVPPRSSPPSPSILSSRPRTCSSSGSSAYGCWSVWLSSWSPTGWWRAASAQHQASCRAVHRQTRAVAVSTSAGQARLDPRPCETLTDLRASMDVLPSFYPARSAGWRSLADAGSTISGPRSA